MEPTLPVGSTPRVTSERPRAGDVALFARRSGELVTHRLIQRIWLPRILGGARWIEAGDAFPRRAGLIRESQIVGRVDTPCRPRSGLDRLILSLGAAGRALRARMV
jgi:hypothetical protein